MSLHEPITIALGWLLAANTGLTLAGLAVGYWLGRSDERDLHVSIEDLLKEDQE